MRKWVYDRPWIWIVLFLALVVGGSFVTLVVAEVNKPEIVKPKDRRHHRGGPSSSATSWRLDIAPLPGGGR